jgi:thioredoxin 1
MDEEPTEPKRADLDAMQGPVLVEFGTEWCGHCRQLAPALARMLKDYPAITHLKVEDGPGRPLGRSFRVKLWPTLVFMKDGAVIQQVSRPEPGEVRAGLAAIDGAATPP